VTELSLHCHYTVTALSPFNVTYAKLVENPTLIAIINLHNFFSLNSLFKTNRYVSTVLSRFKLLQ